MIIINKSGYLKYKNLKFRCALGKAGIGKKKIEGDSITPRGKFNIVKIYYRSDRVKKISSKYRLIKISKNNIFLDNNNQAYILAFILFFSAGGFGLFITSVRYSIALSITLYSIYHIYHF